jgi:DNA-binding GntR family transcriptional regulator
LKEQVKIERRPLGEQVTNLVRRMILTGDLRPGQRLVEERLAKRIGTSRTPIREALHRLEQENLVERPSKGGYTVRPMSVREVEDVIGVRAALESYAVELAARSITPDQLARLEKNVEEYQAALGKKQMKRLVELNTDFHGMLYQIADSQLLTRLATDLAEVLYRFRVSLLGDLESAARSLKGHRRMLAAIREGDADRAARACREHIHAGGKWILAQIREKCGESE